MQLRTHSRISRTLTLAFAVALALAASSSRPAKADERGRVIEITAKRFAFEPGAISLKKGEKVTLRLHSQEVPMGSSCEP